ncbi:NAD-dependent epimerase/dehydratase family protein [Halorubrum sp. BOL3-1]|uniref:NAD-dependent epimerase/dehydratase family protein n=1 Tax=Halorubrum sp. BOL3-1 TaxID=2497325 RepID=UPI001004F904|nr:NAD-dependent epimerase/dehydratase family protein [Halorubrum sp. BOL3-1]QAU12256.1 NAD-dependent epimerase/dehydratase family protein [Halorubrum sp. BOL3-1]
MSDGSSLVAGGAGFLGSQLCESLLDDGHQVYCLDNESSGRSENIESFRNRNQFTYIKGDVCDLPDLPAVDEVYHFASRASPRDFKEHPIEIARSNTEGTRNLLEYCVEQDARMLYASTSEVYGDPEEHPQTESCNGNVNIRGPRSCYDESKRFGETLVVTYEREHDIDVRTARIFNTYGPRMRQDDRRVVPIFIRQALNGENLTVYGDGTQTRSFCFVEDEIRGLRRLMETNGLCGEVVNIGSDHEVTITELAEVILSAVESSSKITHKPLPKDDPERRQPDITRANTLLDWWPKTELNERIDRTIQQFTGSA